MTDTATNIALRGLSVIREQHNIVAENIENVDNLNYKRKELKIDSTNYIYNQGIEVMTDRFLAAELQSKITDTGRLSKLDEYMQKIQNLFGAPGDKFNMVGRLNEVFISQKTLELDPNVATNKYNAVHKLENMAKILSSNAQSLQDMRYQLDNEVNFVIQEINNQLDLIDDLKGQLNSYPKGSKNYANAQMKLEVTLERLAQNIGIKSGYNTDGAFYVSTNTGVSLADDLSYELQYTPQTSVDAIIKGTAFAPISVAAQDGKNFFPTGSVIAPLGEESNFNYASVGGYLGGLLEMRDKIIPQSLNQLDSMALTFKENFNRWHNLGSGFPPATQMQGNKAISRADDLDFSGSVVIAAMQSQSITDANGNVRNIVNSAGMPPLQLDFSALDTGNGAGSANIEGVLQEINYNFNQRITSATAALSGLADIRLVSLSNSITAGSNLNLTLEIDNFSNRDIGVQITAVTAQDSLSNNLNPVFTSPSNNVSTSLASQRQGSISLTNPTNLNYPYDITVSYEVTDQGVTKNYTVTYQIHDPQNNIKPYNNLTNGILNARFSATQAIDMNNNNCLKAAASQTALLTATLVDAEGNIIPAGDQTTKGFINIAATAPNWSVGITDKGSAYKGQQNPLIGGAQAFSHYFGLNDLFVSTDDKANWSNPDNTALYLDVRADIKNQTTALATGQLKQVQQSSVPQATFDYNYEVTKGDASITSKILQLQQSNLAFYNAGYKSISSFTLRQYTATTITVTTLQAQNVAAELEISLDQKKALADRLSSIDGVSLNDEIVKMTALQNNFAALTKVIQAEKEMFNTFLAIFR